MIYAQRVFPQHSGLGDTRSASQSVKNLQIILNKIALFTGGDYNVGTPDGKVGHKTASALWKIVSDGVEGLSEADIPVLSQLVTTMDSIIASIPGISEFVSAVRGCLDDRFGGLTDPCSFEAIWKGIEMYDVNWHQTNLVDRIRNAANAAKDVLGPIADRLAPGGAPPTDTAPPFVFQPLVVQYLPVAPGDYPPGTYPPGSFAIRDPGAQKYRILKPIM